MKAIRLIRSITVALVAVGAISAYAQTGSDTAAQPTTGQSTKAGHDIDRALARKVRSALAKTDGISVSHVVVRAKGGAVILEGSVPEEDQIAQVVRITQSVQGVTSVKNTLTIRPEGQ